jgi:hypothetical protein
MMTCTALAQQRGGRRSHPPTRACSRAAACLLPVLRRIFVPHGPQAGVTSAAGRSGSVGGVSRSSPNKKLAKAIELAFGKGKKERKAGERQAVWSRSVRAGHVSRVRMSCIHRVPDTLRRGLLLHLHLHGLPAHSGCFCCWIFYRLSPFI